MNNKEFLTNKSFCPIPWTGLMYNFDGTVKNCIRSSEYIGNIKDNSIEEILLNDNEIKKSMQSGENFYRCDPCYVLEKDKKSFDIISDRIFYLKELKDVEKSLYDTTNFTLNKIDVRWTNLCNFACVYCGPQFSSKWAEELGIRKEVPTDQQQQDFKNFIFKNTAQLKHVYLAGGEPLLMKENLELLEKLYKENPNVKIRINTNLSKVNTSIFELICKFKNVHWTVSVETIDEEYEYIRYGGHWNDFLNNLRTIQNLDHKITFNMLYFLLNYQSLFRCVDYFKEMGFHNNSFVIGPLSSPDYLNVRHLPETVLQSISEEIKNRLEKKPGYLLENSYRNMLSYIQQPFEKNLKNSFEQLKIIDARRNLDSTKIFKELYNHGN